MERIKVFMDESGVNSVETTIDANDVRVEVIDLCNREDWDPAWEKEKDEALVPNYRYVERRMSESPVPREKVIEILRDFDELTEVPGAGFFTIEYDSDDGKCQLSDHDLDGIFHSDEPWEDFLYAIEYDCHYQEMRDLFSRINDRVDEAKAEFDPSVYDQMDRYIDDCVEVIYPYEKYLDQKIRVNISLQDYDLKQAFWRYDMIFAHMTMRELMELEYARYSFLPVIVKAGTYMSLDDKHLGYSSPAQTSKPFDISNRISCISPATCDDSGFHNLDPSYWKEDCFILGKGDPEDGK